MRMGTVQKFMLALIGLGAGYLVFTNPNGVFRASQAARNLIGGSIVDVTTGGKGRTATN